MGEDAPSVGPSKEGEKNRAPHLTRQKKTPEGKKGGEARHVLGGRNGKKVKGPAVFSR